MKFRAPPSGSFALAIAREPAVDELHGLVDDIRAHALLRSKALHQKVDSLDRGRTSGQRAGGRRGLRQAARRGGVFLEWYEVFFGSPQRFAQRADPVVDRARRLEV